jgi:epoxyqueuosine reductase
VSLPGPLAQTARALGFDAFGVVRAQSEPALFERLSAFLDQGRAGEMGWLAADPARRADPKRLWAPVRSIIMLGVNYGPDSDPMATLADPTCGTISVYARNADYHAVIKTRLKALARALIDQAGGEARVFVDTAAVMEKPLAAASGLGWQGKHTNLVSREFGSWLFLGALFTSLDLPAGTPHEDHCGACRRCLDICPTNAFPAPYQLDARRCISYLTIEHKGPIPLEFRTAMGNRIYGCDDCLAVCPWNKFAQGTGEMAFVPRAELTQPKLLTLAALDDAGFRALFRASPIKRIGRDRFLRNVLIALGNGAGEGVSETVERLLDDPSPLVRGAAVWALSRIDPARFRQLKTARLPAEADDTVQAEWGSLEL